MVRQLAQGRTSAAPFAPDVLSEVADVAVRALPHTVEVGVATYTRDLATPPYLPVETWTPDGVPIAAMVVPMSGRQVDVVDDPSELHGFEVKVPLGTDVPADRQVRVLDGPAGGVVLVVDRNERSSTEPVLRLTCHRFVAGEV